MINSVNKAARTARWLRHALVLAMLAVVVVNGWLWLHGGGSYRSGWVTVSGEWPDAPQGHAWVVMTTVSLASLVLLGGLYRLWRLMRLYEAGEFFSTTATRHLRGFALSLVGVVLVDVLLQPALLLVLRLSGARDIGAIALGMDATDVWTLLIGAVFCLITTIMVEARRLAEDNEQIV